jgi:hypothetical protein
MPSKFVRFKIGLGVTNFKLIFQICEQIQKKGIYNLYYIFITSMDLFNY